MSYEHQRTSPPKRAASQAELTARFDKSIEKAVKSLSAVQRRRLHQITLQSYGAFALFDPKVAFEVGLTKAQTQAFYRFASQHGHYLGDAFEDPKADATKAESAERESRRESDAALAAVLTVRQRVRWKAMLGKPIMLTSLSKLNGLPRG